jgi:hypothetical protein
MTAGHFSQIRNRRFIRRLLTAITSGSKPLIRKAKRLAAMICGEPFVFQVGATGFEPYAENDSNECSICGYANCEMGRAANALHSGRLKWLESALIDANLQRVITTWDTLPEAIRRAILALIGSQKT